MKFDYILDKIATHKLEKKPFQYLCIDNFLKENDYKNIIKKIPRDEKWQTHKFKGRRRSWQAQTYTFNHKKLDMISDLSFIFESNEFKKKLFEKFNIKKNYSKGILKTTWCRDYDAFSITPHRDQNSKILSFLFYLPKDNRHKHNGTQILKPLKNLDHKGDNHLQWYDFKKVKDIDFIKNRFICWSVNSKSYHSVDLRFSRGEKNAYRDTVRGFFFQNKEKLPVLFSRY